MPHLRPSGAGLRGEETGLSDEEIAFYDALAENDSARQVMGEPTLRVIAHKLVTVIKGNVSVKVPEPTFGGT
jgi:type I restriction enzyme, R subunit